MEYITIILLLSTTLLLYRLNYYKEYNKLKEVIKNLDELIKMRKDYILRMEIKRGETNE